METSDDKDIDYLMGLLVKFWITVSASTLHFILQCPGVNLKYIC